MEELGDNGDVAVGYLLIDDGGRRKPAAAVGYPLPLEIRAHDYCDHCCNMFTLGFVVTFGLVLVTDFSLAIFLQKQPNPLLVLICFPFIFVIFAGLVLLIICCAASNLRDRESGGLGPT
ncbi:hypothetical protein VPH35_061990 [Triticum aestivum]|uniref:uncharacterized protein n=1 Tax=Triticum aestivum TaxID=4565 RepID=UPI001D00C9FD|nr:uncharacterized protein LOC123075125 [Triticum aestivum]XP_045090385.1 uncharacterized protein LOC123497732 [Aegilops tauschii subsp. strangulata]